MEKVGERSRTFEKVGEGRIMLEKDRERLERARERRRRSEKVGLSRIKH